MAQKPIKIKKSTRGSLTKLAKAAGMTVPQYAAKMANNPKASPAVRKKAVFAKNAEKWNKK